MFCWPSEDRVQSGVFHMCSTPTQGEKLSKQEAVNLVRKYFGQATAEVPEEIPIALNISAMVDEIAEALKSEALRLPRHYPADESNAGYRVNDYQGDTAYAFLDTSKCDRHGRPVLRVLFRIAQNLRDAIELHGKGDFVHDSYLRQLEGPVDDLRRFALAVLAACEHIERTSTEDTP